MGRRKLTPQQAEKRRLERLQYNSDWRKRNPERVKTRDKKYHLKYKEKRLQYSKEWRIKNKEQQRISCAKWRAKNPEKALLSTRRYNVRIKFIIYDHLGGFQCVKCGFTDIRALQFDHIHQAKNSPQFGSRNSELRYYAKNPEECRKYLQILCSNCNWIKRFENDEVDHRGKAQRFGVAARET